MCDGVNVEISGALFIQREILKMDVRFNRRLLRSTTGTHREIGDAIHRNPAGLQGRKACEIEVTSGKIQAKLSVRPADVRPANARRTNGGAPGKWSIVGTGIDVVELKLTTREAEIALQQRHGHSIGHSIVNLEVTIAVRTGARTRNSGRHIQSASKGTSSSGQLRKLGHVGIAGVKVQSKRSALRKPTVRQRGTGVEARRRVAVNERAIVRGKMTAGVLNGRRECVPVNSSCGDAFGCRQDRVKVVDLEISADGKRGEFAAGIAGKARPAVDRKGQIR